VRFCNTIRISILSVLTVLCVSTLAWASEYRGQITFGGFPVPGATVSATQGSKKVSVVSDQGGVYSFDDLADGPWKIEIEMQLFAKLETQVTIAPNMPPAKWELTLLPIDQLMAQSKVTQAPPSLPPATASPVTKKPDTAATAQTEIPKPPDEQSEQSNDGFIVNGSVNNAATSQYSLDRAFGNRRPNSKSLYTGGFAAVLNNSALDARPYSLTGIEAPKALYDRVTAAYCRRTDQDSPHPSTRTKLLSPPTNGRATTTRPRARPRPHPEAERAGDLSGLLNLSRPTPGDLRPVTGMPFEGCAGATGQTSLSPLPRRPRLCSRFTRFRTSPEQHRL
jgi:hypothetical protein